MIRRLLDRDLDALRLSIPLHQLLPLAGLDRITLDLAAHPASQELELKRRALTRLKAGEFCMIPGWKAGAYGVPMIHIGHALRRFDDDRHADARQYHTKVTP